MAKLAFNGGAGEGNGEGIDGENADDEGNKKDFGKHDDREECRQQWHQARSGRGRCEERE